MICFLTSRPDPPDSDHLSLNPANRFADELLRALPRPCRVLNVCSDPEGHKITDYYASFMKASLENAGADLAEFRVLDSRNEARAAELIGSSDLLILSGGHVPTQNRFFQRIGLRELLRSFDGVLLGISAGSMNCAELVYAQPEEEGEAVDPAYQRFLPGLGLTKRMILPHYQELRVEVLDGLRVMEDIACPDSLGREFLCFPDGSYLYIENGREELRGEAYLLADGRLTELHAGEAENALEAYYQRYDEESRLLSRHGQVEYLTTMRYIRESLAGVADPAILEIGAGTGRYSVTLAKQGLRVTAVELVARNLERLRAKLDGTEPITTLQGNALDLSSLPDNAFDLTLVLGPMYHLYTREDKLQALSEAVRVTKPGGRILAAYCMNEATVIQFVFGRNNLQLTQDQGLLTQDWHCRSEPKQIFDLVRTEDIAALDAALPVERVKLVATDGPTNYHREMVDAMDDRSFAKWMDYHFAVCERQDLIGASHHSLDILRKRS